MTPEVETLPVRHCRVGLATVPRDGLCSKSAYGDSGAIQLLVREALLQSGLGKTDAQRPLADIIKPGCTVLLKPNWVLHYNQSGKTMDCMITHPAFILAVVREVAAAQAGRIVLADAPIQSAKWDELVSDAFREALAHAAGQAALEVVDLRRTVVKGSDFVKGVGTEQRGEERCVRFDLGRDSLLEAVSGPKSQFRITSYDPGRLANTHGPGRHKYVLAKEVFEAEVVINLPKLKTHRKAGLTAALKNLVGMNGDKENLPHHRIGGTFWGGDCYEGCAPLKRLAETLLDAANRRIGTKAYARWAKWVHLVLGWQRHFGDTDIEGGWHGNDTVWRMVLDLNRILIYGRIDGTMAETPQRTIYSLTDAIVCGAGNGPLSPAPRFLGAVTFSAETWAADAVHCALLGLEEKRIPLVRESRSAYRWPLKRCGGGVEIRHKGRVVSLDEVATELGIRAKPPTGWVGHIERPEPL